MFTFRKNGHFYEKIGKKGEPVCIDDEIPFDIPDTWEWCKFENIIELISGRDLKKTQYNDLNKGIPYVTGASNIINNQLLINRWTEEPAVIAIKKDILLSCKGTIGKILILNEDKVHIARQIMSIRLIDETLINREYIVIFLMYYVNNLINIAKSMIPGISREDVLKINIPLPPLNEQKRMVKEINKLNPLINEYGINKKKLDKLNSEFPDKLKSSILQEAIQGKLVPQDSNDEPASVLLEKIRDEKERLIKEKKIKRNKNESYIFKENNHFYEKIGKEVVDITNDLPFEIPGNWMWCKLENITSNIHYGYTASAQEVGDVRLLRITDIHENNVNWDSVPYCVISEDKLANYILRNRDIVMARTGGTIGKSYIINNLNKKAVFASYLIRIIPLKNINENYLKQFFESPLFWSQLRDNTKGTGQPNVNAKSLKNLLIPIPPFIEQEIIVNKIEKIFNEINLRLKV
ncbi:MAG: restriction endonuclease subunit S [Methanobrevibacter sp.]|uniref:restriction endonuclease subunit S n=1 Tax=Methanobrevibacter sp. TaxID=66852 RepID=UPI0025F2F432|nr:restriction endonuclease subunit S [Methanobrevibacter sp.]MBE6496725.1 restriction endonuclease subunit S [Methanobrevibacter sp.]